LAEEVKAFRTCFTTQDFKDGLTALLEKRQQNPKKNSRYGLTKPVSIVGSA
jgi:hypothetical protein